MGMQKGSLMGSRNGLKCQFKGRVGKVILHPWYLSHFWDIFQACGNYYDRPLTRFRTRHKKLAYRGHSGAVLGP